MSWYRSYESILNKAYIKILSFKSNQPYKKILYNLISYLNFYLIAHVNKVAPQKSRDKGL